MKLLDIFTKEREKKPIVGFDIDGVIFSIERLFYSCVNDFAKEYDIDTTQFDYTKYSVAEVSNGTIDTKLFWYKYSEYIHTHQVVRSDAVEIINALRKLGCKIYLITTRSLEGLFADPFVGCEDFLKFTMKQLKDNHIYYDELCFHASDKSVICNLHDIDYMIDDSVNNLEDLKRAKCKTFVYHHIYNKDYKDAIRVHNLTEYYNYIVQDMSKES